MKGLLSEHVAAAEDKPTTSRVFISPTKTNGNWSERLPAFDQYQRCLLCPMCNASICRLKTSNTPKNPSRQFYTCPTRDHNFFKWADEVNPNQLIDVPDCGGCSAGACRVRRETIGPNAGRILFMCRVKEGEGSCGYRVWQDELEMSTSSQSTNNCDDLLTLLETMDVKDHVAMRQAAEATFTAMDHLPFGHQDFKNCVNELIHCASSLSEIEQSMHTNDSYQRLVEHCSRERTRLEEINCVHAETTYTVTNKKKHLKDLQKEISSTLDWLFRIEAELSCFDVEMRDIELGLEQISRDKEELEGKYSIAFKELEETKKLFERKEAEFDAAKAAYYRARALLRG
ncbi:hypothetical protein ACS0TY_011725 [Phlomoides rotata]